MYRRAPGAAARAPGRRRAPRGAAATERSVRARVCAQLVRQPTEATMPLRGKVNNPAGGCPSWSEAGRRAIPPGNVSGDKEWYDPKTGLFAAQRAILRDQDKAFDTVRANDLHRSEFAGLLLQDFDERRAVYIKEFQAQTEQGIQVEQLKESWRVQLQEMNDLQDNIKKFDANFDSNDLLNRVEWIQPSPAELLDLVQRDVAARTARESENRLMLAGMRQYCDHVYQQTELLWRMREGSAHKVSLEKEEAEYQRMRRQTVAIAADLASLHETLGTATRNREMGPVR